MTGDRARGESAPGATDSMLVANTSLTPPAWPRTAAAEAQRVLDAAARRLLAARVYDDAIATSTGCHGRAIYHRPDERPPLADGQ